jgi:hypothetical protein
MIATHAMDLAGKMNIDQMQEAVKLGAIIEIDYRNAFDECAIGAGGRRTPQGHILINTGLTQTIPQIKAGVEQLGFKLTDVKILTKFGVASRFRYELTRPNRWPTNFLERREGRARPRGHIRYASGELGNSYRYQVITGKAQT